MTSLESIADVGIFKGLTDKQLDVLDAVARVFVAKEGERLFRTGESASELFVIVDGVVELTIPLSIVNEERELAAQELSRGETFGWSALVEPHRLTMSARVKSQAELVKLEGRVLKDLLSANPDIGYLVMANLAATIGRRLSMAHALWARELQRSIDRKYGHADGAR